MTDAFRVAVVIVNYRTAELTIDCLASLHAPGALSAGTRIVVVDGSSGDGSVRQIAKAIDAEAWSDRTTLLALDANRGFGHGNNRGLEQIRLLHGEPEYVLFLNPDTIVRSNALGELVAFMDREPAVGVAGSMLEDPDGTPQACAFAFPSALGELEGEAHVGIISMLAGKKRVLAETGSNPSRVDWVSGASMMVRSQVLRDIGGVFDDGYFLYYEEVDLCLRARKAGWDCYHVPQSHVVHLVGQSTGVTSRGAALPRRPAYWFASRRRYFLKHHGSTYLALADLGWLIGHLIFRAKQYVKRLPSGVPPHILGDFLSHSVRRKSRV